MNSSTLSSLVLRPISSSFEVAFGNRRWIVARLLAAESQSQAALSPAGHAFVEMVVTSTDAQLDAIVGMTTSQNSFAKPHEVGEKNHDAVSIPVYLHSTEEVSPEQKKQALAKCVSRYGIHPNEIELSDVEAVSQPLNEHDDSLIRLDLTLKSTEMRLQILLVVVQTAFETRYELFEPRYDLCGLATSMANLGRQFRLSSNDAALSWASLWLILKGATPLLPDAPWPLVSTAKLPSTRYPENYWRSWRFVREASGPIATIPYLYKNSLLLGKVLVPEDGVSTRLIAEPETIMPGLNLLLPRFIARQKDGPPTGLWYVGRRNA